MKRQFGRARVWIGIAVALVVVLAVAQSGAGHRLLLAAGLAAEPSVTTELYFDPDVAVPPTLEPGTTVTVPVGFFIGNVSTENRNVPWEIVDDSTGSFQVRGNGVADGLRPQDRRSETVSIPLSCGPGPAFELAVRVPGESVEVRRRINCEPGSR